MIRTVWFFVSFAISLTISMIFSVGYFILGWMGLKDSQHRYMLKVTQTWAKYIIFSSGNKINVVNSDKVPDGPVLFVSNHQSYFDIPVLMVNTPHFAAFVAKVELSKVPMLSFWMKQMGCLFMDRKDMRQSLKIILEGIEKLKNGESLIIFPEGTRNHMGETDEFKPGSLKLAIKAKVPIVPVTLVNTYKVYEEFNRVKTADVSVIFHDPIYLDQLSREETNVLHDTIRDIIINPLKR